MDRAAARRWAVVVGLVLAGGCNDPTEILNPEFVEDFGFGPANVASLPGEAPGLAVFVENQTTRWIAVTVSYRDGDGNARSYTQLVGPGERTGQMLVCQVQEITLGNVSDLDAVGAIVYLNDPGIDNFADAPFVEVEPFGLLLRSGVNYECGDGVDFIVRSSQSTASRYQTFVRLRRN